MAIETRMIMMLSLVYAISNICQKSYSFSSDSKCTLNTPSDVMGLVKYFSLKQASLAYFSSLMKNFRHIFLHNKSIISKMFQEFCYKNIV